MKNITKDKFSINDSLSFIIPSLIGVLLFIIPIKFNGEITIPVALMSNFLASSIGEYLTTIITIAVCISALLSVITKFFKPEFIIKNEFLNTLFNIKPLWVISRVLGAVFCVLSLFNVGPEIIISSGTGSFVLNDLLTVLFTIFFFAGLLLPLLLILDC